MTGWLSTIRTSAVPFAAFALVFRVFCIFQYRISSDEPQHLHVAWLWSRGLIGYRDFYDNHTPLFHLICAPFLAMIGETPDIFLFARAMMVPLAAASLALVYFIAAKIYDRQVATWTTIAAAVLPTFILRTTEFRNDNLWVVWSLLAIALALSPVTPRRAALIAFVIALSLLTSIKTAFLAAALGVALLVVDRPSRSIVLAALGGFIAPIAAALAWFFRHDALQQFYWCAIWINGQIPFPLWRRTLGLLLVVTAIALVVWRLRRSSAPRGPQIVAATTALFIAFVLALSPLVSPRDFLPALPLLVLFGVAAVGTGRFARFGVIAFVIWTVLVGRLFLPPRPYHQSVVEEAIALTRPNEMIFDLKGETVFRRRPSYLALETASRSLLSRGLAKETFVEDLIRARCYVATKHNRRFPDRTREFLARHFVEVGSGALRVAGSPVDDGAFRIGVPGPYIAIGPNRTIIAASRWYEPGVYRAPQGATHVLWAPAIERGFWPVY